MGKLVAQDLGALSGGVLPSLPSTTSSVNFTRFSSDFGQC